MDKTHLSSRRQISGTVASPPSMTTANASVVIVGTLVRRVDLCAAESDCEEAADNDRLLHQEHHVAWMEQTKGVCVCACFLFFWGGVEIKRRS